MASSKLKKIRKNDETYLFQNYGSRLDTCFVKGDGSLLYDQDGKEYVDFFAGIAVTNLGHRHPAVTKAIIEQSEKLLHTSNWYLNREQTAAAGLLSELTFPGKTFFCNSGTEANEAAIKLARRYGLEESKQKIKIISFKNSFHGRTYGSMSATGQQKIHRGFGPVVKGFTYSPYNDIKAFKKTAGNGKQIAAVMLELVQGEGGIIEADRAFVKELFDFCKKKGILTIIDEVQTGIGRTGAPFAYQQYNIVPDILTLAKGLGNGIPVGAMHSKSFLVDHLPPGSHGTTFGGNHLASAVVCAVLKEMKKTSLMKNVQKTSLYIKQRLEDLKEKCGIIEDVRGPGLHIGIVLSVPGMDLVKEGLKRGLVINCTAGNIIRIMPPLTIDRKTVQRGMDILEDIMMSRGTQNENS